MTKKEVREAAETLLGIEDNSAILRWYPDRSLVVVSVRSEKPDRVLASMLERLKDDAARQLTVAVPGFLCVQLADVSSSDLLELARAESQETGLRRLVERLLQARPQIHTLVFTNGNAVESGRGLNVAPQEAGVSWIFRSQINPHFHRKELEALFPRR